MINKILYIINDLINIINDYIKYENIFFNKLIKIYNTIEDFENFSLYCTKYNFYFYNLNKNYTYEKYKNNLILHNTNLKLINKNVSNIFELININDNIENENEEFIGYTNYLYKIYNNNIKIKELFETNILFIEKIIEA